MELQLEEVTDEISPYMLPLWLSILLDFPVIFSSPESKAQMSFAGQNLSCFVFVIIVFFFSFSSSSLELQTWLKASFDKWDSD